MYLEFPIKPRKKKEKKNKRKGEFDAVGRESLIRRLGNYKIFKHRTTKMKKSKRSWN